MTTAASVRTLAALALLGQLLFVAAWLLAGALEPGYSHVQQPIHELAQRGAEHPWIMDAGYVVLGLSLAALALCVLRVLPGGRAARVGAAGFLVVGLCFVLVAFGVDGWIGLLARVALLATPFAVARALWARPAAAIALGAGIAGVAIGVAVVAFWVAGGEGAAGGGLVERAELLLLHNWVAWVAIGALYETRPAPRLPAPTPVPPRDFFGRAWDGEGETVLWPAFLWRHLPLRFRATRVATWLTEDTWTFDDEATFAHGWTQRRRRFCQFVTPQHIHVTAEDLPNGADVLLDDDGYRIAPFTMLIPVGPLRLPLRCHEHGRMDGRTLVDTVELRFLGLPAGRAVMRVAPTGA